MKKIILLVDDEEASLESLQRLLSDEGYCVLTARCDSDGIVLLKNHDIQVVISDHQRQRKDGPKFLTKVKELYPHIICMILSSYNNFDAMKEAINEGGIYKFISKPWEDNVLLQCVHDAFVKYINSNKNNQKAVNYVARDLLTHLQNRFSLYESLWKIISDVQEKKASFYIVMIDIDRFSHINERLGQEYGNQVLQQFAKRLNKFTKVEQNLARMGNDEFVLIVTANEDLTNLITYIQQLVSMTKKPMIINGIKQYLTVSIGISRYPEHGESAEILMEHARVALLYCKALGGDQYRIYETYMNKINENTLDLEVDLYQALEKKQFVLYYQPIYTIDKAEIAGVEALIRWQNPQQGLLLPRDFLNFCEETNLIIPIGEWVLRTACQQIKLWHGLGFPTIRLSVNLSARQLYHPGLYDLIIDILRRTQLSPEHLELEITETLIMENTDRVIPLLNSLRDLGIHLSLDDFGTGYSSLSYLRKFPFTSLKIDQSFVSELCVSKTGGAIVETIISLGKLLGMRVIAEGVETAAQLAVLQETHCDLIQGFLYSRPLPEKDILQLLLNHN